MRRYYHQSRRARVPFRRHPVLEVEAMLAATLLKNLICTLGDRCLDDLLQNTSKVNHERKQEVQTMNALIKEVRQASAIVGSVNSAESCLARPSAQSPRVAKCPRRTAAEKSRAASRIKAKNCEALDICWHSLYFSRCPDAFLPTDKMFKLLKLRR
jgi:hypothetical protein